MNIRNTRLGKFLIAANQFNQDSENSCNANELKHEFIEAKLCKL